MNEYQETMHDEGSAEANRQLFFDKLEELVATARANENTRLAYVCFVIDKPETRTDTSVISEVMSVHNSNDIRDVAQLTGPLMKHHESSFSDFLGTLLGGDDSGDDQETEHTNL